MITREIITEQYNRVVVKSRYPATGDCACVVQLVSEEGEIIWEEGEYIFTQEMLNLTEEEVERFTIQEINEETEVENG